MKKIILLGVMLTMLESCKKDFTCQCDVLDKQSSTINYNVSSSTVNAKNTNEAQDKCSLHDENSTSYYKQCKVR